MQVAEKESSRGSLKWIRLAINEHTTPFNSAVAEACGLGDGSRIEWISPLARKGYKEHCDQACLDHLSITLPHRSLSDFWPKSGPHWDALGRTDTGEILLVEAKANVPEIVSNGTGASDPASRQLIDRSLTETKAFLRVDANIPWSGKLYQYANRLAHLYLLRELNGIPAFLVFV